MNEHLMEALRRLRHSSTDTNVDRRLVTNVLLSFLNTPRADSKRFEMLSLLATVLSWSDDEREKAGLQRKSALSSAATGMSALWSRSGSTSPAKGKGLELEKTDETEVRHPRSGNFIRRAKACVSTVVLAPVGRVPPHGGGGGRRRPAVRQVACAAERLPAQHADADEPPLSADPARHEAPPVVHRGSDGQLAGSDAPAAPVAEGEGEGDAGRRVVTVFHLGVFCGAFFDLPYSRTLGQLRITLIGNSSACSIGLLIMHAAKADSCTK
ncbi:hypothetical protein B0H21DRAFT_64099 [Amylocystis lapponica]|nr:hypothetical protein B0H21DRAFT_64099 [Amylocystis lapponica]